MYRHWYHYDTHLLMTGGTGMGKSSLNEAWRRDCLTHHEPMVSVMSGKGVYEKFIDFVNYYRPKQKVICIDLSNPEHIVPCNWFSNVQGEDIGAHSTRIAEAVAGAWGAKNTNDMMTYAAKMGSVVRWCAETGLPIQRAIEWLQYKSPLQEKAYNLAKSDDVRQFIMELRGMSRNEWAGTIRSTLNRLHEFSNSTALRRFTCTKEAIDIPAEVRRGSVIAVNITPQNDLAWPVSSVFAALLVSELLRADGRCFVHLDECEHYLSFDAVKLLDTSRARGLRFSLICHSDGQFDDPRTQLSVGINCGIKVVFGGLPPELRRKIALTMFEREINTRKIKDEFYGSEQVREDYETRSETDSESENDGGSSGTVFNEFTGQSDSETVTRQSGKSRSKGVQKGNRFVPGARTILTGRTEFSMEEKISLAAEILNTPRGVYHVKTPKGTTKASVPFIHSYSHSAKNVLEFEHTIPAHLIDQQEQESHDQFTGATDARPKRTTKKELSPKNPR